MPAYFDRLQTIEEIGSVEILRQALTFDDISLSVVVLRCPRL